EPGFTDCSLMLLAVVIAQIKLILLDGILHLFANCNVRRFRPRKIQSLASNICFAIALDRILLERVVIVGGSCRRGLRVIGLIALIFRSAFRVARFGRALWYLLLLGLEQRTG